MSIERKPGESFEAYKLRRKVDEQLTRMHERGQMFFLATRVIKGDDDKLYRQYRTYVKPKEAVRA